MKIHLVAIDLDGTLLNSAKQVTGTTAAILRDARKTHGLRVVLASARPPRSTLPFYRQLDLDTPMINYNGALVYDPLSRNVLLHRPVPLDVARALTASARKHYPPVLVSAEILDRWFTDRVDAAYLTETARSHPPDVVGPLNAWLDRPVTKLLFLGEPLGLKKIVTAFHKEFTHQVEMVQTEAFLLQIMHATVSKEQALRGVAAEMGVDRSQVMAIGDNVNDVGMLRWAGVGVAMSNAAPEALRAADYVAPSNDADGAAKAIHEIIVKGLKVAKKRR
jgi:Cof subfamily protein (haloacid dehalogenase superfamily)